MSAGLEGAWVHGGDATHVKVLTFDVNEPAGAERMIAQGRHRAAKLGRGRVGQHPRLRGSSKKGVLDVVGHVDLPDSARSARIAPFGRHSLEAEVEVAYLGVELRGLLELVAFSLGIAPFALTVARVSQNNKGVSCERREITSSSGASSGPPKA